MRFPPDTVDFTPFDAVDFPPRAGYNHIRNGGDDMTRWHVVFTGRVQHVGFRYTAFYFSRDLYLTGWVDNKPDGSVEMEVQGGPLQLQKLLSRLKGQFDIDRVEVTKKDPIPHERGFRVKGY